MDKKCTSCGESIPDEKNQCLVCGELMESIPGRRKILYALFFVLYILLEVFGFSLGFHLLGIRGIHEDSVFVFYGIVRLLLLALASWAVWKGNNVSSLPLKIQGGIFLFFNGLVILLFLYI